MRVFRKATLSYPLYELIKKYSNSSFAQGSRQGEGGGVFQEIGAVDLATICVAPLRSVLEYTVTWLDITLFLPICLVN